MLEMERREMRKWEKKGRKDIRATPGRHLIKEICFFLRFSSRLKEAGFTDIKSSLRHLWKVWLE